MTQQTVLCVVPSTEVTIGFSSITIPCQRNAIATSIVNWPVVKTPAIIVKPAYQPETIAYKSNIINNNGTISDIDLNAIDTFVKGIYANNLRDLIIRFDPIAGDNLNSALIGLFVPDGVSTSLVNNNFVNADYNRTVGLTGNGNNKQLDSGIVASTYYTGSSTYYGSLGAYLSVYGSGINGVDIGYNDGSGGNAYALGCHFSDGNAYFNPFNSGSNVLAITASSKGFYQANTTMDAFYLNGSLGSNFVQYGGEGVPQAKNIYYFSNGGGNYSARAIGCFLIGFSVSSIQASTLNSLIQTLMTAFGR